MVTQYIRSGYDPEPPEVDKTRSTEGDSDWFIARAISQTQSTSAPLTPRPRSSSSNSLADILARHPPSTNAQPFRPPVFLYLGPSNKGWWAMLQNQGWYEGEDLVTGNGGRSGNDARDDEAKNGAAEGDEEV